MDHFTSKVTHCKIGKLAQEWTPNTVLILVNYIFFKGKTFSNDCSDPFAVCYKAHLSLVPLSLPLQEFCHLTPASPVPAAHLLIPSPKHSSSLSG